MGRGLEMFQRIRRCYNCGLAYSRRRAQVCPRCGDARLTPKWTRFNDSAGLGWKLGIGSSVNAAGLAARDLRTSGNEDLWDAARDPLDRRDEA